MKRLNILVTNDDGIVAPGLRALVEVARQFGNVTVIAPDSPQSAKGHSITIYEPLRLKKVEIFEGIESYECSGTPVDCVKLAKHVVFKDRQIDLCLSGINHGSNASINIIYSGTMSAAMEASLEGIDSIGFSLLDSNFNADFTPAQHWIPSIIRFVIEQKGYPGRLYNVNIPLLPADQIRGFKFCRQAEARWTENFIENKDPHGRPYFWLTGEFVLNDPHPDTDIHALHAGYISIVPSMHDLTNYALLEQLQSQQLLSPT